MRILDRKIPLILLLGDVACFFVALWLMLSIRYQLLPRIEIFVEHLIPFGFLFVLWVGVFFISGLYEKRSVVFKKKLPGIILQTQIVNSIIAAIFFYFVPIFGISPKTNLFLYLFISLVLVYIWRAHGYYFFGGRKQENAVLIGSGEEMHELKKEVSGNSYYNLTFISSVDLDVVSLDFFRKEVLPLVENGTISSLVVDIHNKKVEPLLPELYNLIFSNIRFLEMHKVYEDVFSKVPLSLVRYNWFLENIPTTPKVMYDILKRAMDLIIASFLFLPSLLVYPFVACAIKYEDRGSIFFTQERVGKNNVRIRVHKFRSMSVLLSDGSVQKITRVGAILRKTRIDELPQLINVFRGDLSLIGPRPEMPKYVQVYEEEIPFYNIRHTIKPGLSGWAQLYQKDPPKFETGFSQTKNKLAFDLFYIKNRSLLLDVTIALKTLKELFLRRGV